MTEEYFIERFDMDVSGGNFHLLKKVGDDFYNLASLFYDDIMFENKWLVYDLSSPPKKEDDDEEESTEESAKQLIKITADLGDKLIAMADKSPEEIFDFFEKNVIAEYFIERLNEGECSFNLWKKVGNTYHNLATLFYYDCMCRDQWSVDPAEKAVKYNEQELADELENPLKKIPSDLGDKLMSMADKSPEEIADFFEENINANVNK